MYSNKYNNNKYIHDSNEYIHDKIYMKPQEEALEDSISLLSARSGFKPLH